MVVLRTTKAAAGQDARGPRSQQILTGDEVQVYSSYLHSCVCLKLERFGLSILQVHLEHVGHAQQGVSLENTRVALRPAPPAPGCDKFSAS